VAGQAFAARRGENAGSSRPKFVVEGDQKLGEPIVSAPEESAEHPLESASESVKLPQGRSEQKQADLLSSAGDSSWRKEVSDRLHRYHARRRPRAPRYPSL